MLAQSDKQSQASERVEIYMQHATPQMSAVKRQALRLSDQRRKVIELRPKDKRPVRTGWQTDLFPTIQDILAFCEHCNIGVVCGRVSGGLWVLDFDSQASYEAFCEAFPGLVETYTVKSVRGWHLWFECETAPVKRSINTALGHIDLIGEGGYVVAPPSIHPDGPQYTEVAPHTRPSSSAASNACENLSREHNADFSDGSSP